MKNINILLACFAIFLSSVSCFAPSRAYPEEMPPPIYATIPPSVQRGEELPISIETRPGAVCQATILFWDINDKWVHEELPTITADEDGLCKWRWKIPDNAKDGQAELRGRVELGSEGKNIFPSSFCIEKCK